MCVYILPVYGIACLLMTHVLGVTVSVIAWNVCNLSV